MKRVMVNMTDEKYEQLQLLKKWLQQDGFDMSESNLLNYCFNKAYNNAKKVKQHD